MTLAQLSAFVMVARLGSVQEAAAALGITPSAVSHALRSLRRHLGDRLVTMSEGEMHLTPGGERLLPIASDMVHLGHHAHQVVHEASGRHQLRIVADPVLAEFAGATLTDAYRVRDPDCDIVIAAGSPSHMAALVLDRSVDVAIGPRLVDAQVICEPVLRFDQVVVAAGGEHHLPSRWLAGPSGTDPDSTLGQAKEALGVHDDNVRIYASHAAAWHGVADGQGVSAAPAHLVRSDIATGRLKTVPVDGTVDGATGERHWYVSTLVDSRCSEAAGRFRRFLQSPAATRALLRPDEGVAPRRFRPPVHVGIWDPDVVERALG